jgi:MFS family permease
MTTATAGEQSFETNIPARMDRLPWSGWHWRIVIGLGAVWILDGLEVTLVGVVAPRLQEAESGLGLSASQATAAGLVYVAGAVLGALFFGRLTDRYGRKKLFLLTLALYLAATIGTGLSFSVGFFYVMRFLVGAGIGGEYAAINSAIDELIPARVRGAVDLIINGSFWLGTALCAALALILLNTSIFAADVGWRLGFGLGALLGLGILWVRRQVPESPRWMLMHGRPQEAEEVVSEVEHAVVESSDHRELDEPDRHITIRPRGAVSFREIARTLLAKYRRRTLVGLSLFIGQAFVYNAVFFTQGTVLTKIFKVDSGDVPLYIIPFALGNFMGPLLLGRLYDTVGRRVMIAGTYITSGVLLFVTALLFREGTFDATSITIAWSIIFFFASAGASSAYLTVSEIFPMETRALSIALFYSVGTGIGGITGLALFTPLMEKGAESIAWGYILGAALMIGAGVVQAVFGVEAAQRSLEDVATPLSAEGEEAAEEERPRERRPEPARRRRPRLGPSAAQLSYAPRYPTSSRAETDEDVEREVEEIVRALESSGPTRRRELGDMVHCRYWGPGRFRRALRAAVEQGRIRRVGRDRYAPA